MLLYKEYTERIINACIQVHTEIGNGYLEEVYADFLCYDEIIVELKSVSSINNVHKAQVINYLKSLDKKIGLLINFYKSSLTWERISFL